MMTIWIDINTNDNEVKIEVIDKNRQYELLENAYLDLIYERDKKGLSIHY